VHNFNIGGTQPLKLPTPAPLPSKPKPDPKDLAGVGGVVNARQGADEIKVKPGTGVLTDMMAPDPLFAGAPDSVFTGAGTQAQVFEKGCVAAMFAKEWENQRPEQYAAARTALAVPGGKVDLGGGKTLEVPAEARAQIDADPALGVTERQDAYVQAALMGEGDFAARFDDSAGLSEPGIRVLNDALDLGITLNESGAPKVGDYVAIGQDQGRHFMKIVGEEGGMMQLADGYGNTAEASPEQLAIADRGAIGVVTGGGATQTSVRTRPAPTPP